MQSQGILILNPMGGAFVFGMCSLSKTYVCSREVLYMSFHCIAKGNTPSKLTGIENEPMEWWELSISILVHCLVNQFFCELLQSFK